jgi:hypothetical protein
MKNLLLFFLFTLSNATLFGQNGQCPSGQKRVKVEIQADNNPSQITWDVVTVSGDTLMKGFSVSDSLCADNDTCIRFTIHDAAGNGLCCAEGIGRYRLWYDGFLVRSNYKFDSLESMWLGCPSCEPATGERQIRVYINPDRYPQEISWNLMTGNNDTLAKGRTFGDTVCVPVSGCLRFKMLDSYGDGICCNQGQGDYRVYSGDSLLFSGGTYAFSDSKTESCPPGFDCSSAIEASLDTFTTYYDDTWYRYKPDTTGRFEISTCNLGNSCNTKIWVYEYCNNLQPSEGNAGTLAYSFSGCGSQALLPVIFEKNVSYYIRIGDDFNTCNPDAVTWALRFLGPIVGCMDPASCSYNPLATVSDTTLCLYNPDPDCPEQPDLVVNSDLLKSSFKFDSLQNNDPCYIQEGCLKGMGQRYIIRFSTRIENIGDADYYIGKPPATPTTPSTQWIWDPCHAHWHYKGYAEYLLFDKNSNPIPAGFKAGFCVMDLNCSLGGGIPKYNCANQGVTAGCGDIYDRSLKCQWVDITDVDTGRYTLVARVNWDNSPDKLGRIESNLYNNWGQVCLEISKNSSGRRFAKVLNECNPFVDCQGQVFGPARRDCNGVCQGTAVHGDINGDSLRNQEDMNLYLAGITDGSLSSSPCRDLNGDSELDAADLAMMQHCLSSADSAAQSENCTFGPLFSNPESQVTFGIDTVNVLEGYADLTILNLQDEVSAFQFRISGVVPDSVRFLSLADSGDVILKSHPGGTILSAMLGNRLPRHNQPGRFLRVYFDSISSSQLCISSIQVAMSPARHLLAGLAGPCKNIQQITRVKSRTSGQSCRVVPNPFRTETTLLFPEVKNQTGSLRIFDAQGRLVFTEDGISGNSYLLKNKQLRPGLYRFVLQSSEVFSGTLLLQP